METRDIAPINSRTSAIDTMTKSACTNPTNSIPTLRRVGPTSPSTWIKPQLAELVEKAPDGSDWLHEIKFDVRGLRWTRNDGSRERPGRRPGSGI